MTKKKATKKSDKTACFVEVRKGDETIMIHSSAVTEHKRLGWAVVDGTDDSK